MDLESNINEWQIICNNQVAQWPAKLALGNLKVNLPTYNYTISTFGNHNFVPIRVYDFLKRYLLAKNKQNEDFVKKKI